MGLSGCLEFGSWEALACTSGLALEPESQLHALGPENSSLWTFSLMLNVASVCDN